MGKAQSYDLVKPINIIGDPCVGLGQAQSYDLVKPINIIGNLCVGLGQAQSYDLVKPINIIGNPCVGQAQSVADLEGGVRGVLPPPLKFAKHMLYNVN